MIYQLNCKNKKLHYLSYLNRFLKLAKKKRKNLKKSFFFKLKRGYFIKHTGFIKLSLYFTTPQVVIPNTVIFVLYLWTSLQTDSPTNLAIPVLIPLFIILVLKFF